MRRSHASDAVSIVLVPFQTKDFFPSTRLQKSAVLHWELATSTKLLLFNLRRLSINDATPRRF